MKVTDSNSLQVLDVFTESDEEIQFRDRVIELALGFNHLVVATAAQLCIYRVGNWNTPIHVMDSRATVSLIILCDRHFLTVDNVTGIQLITYDGRVLCNPRYPVSFFYLKYIYFLSFFQKKFQQGLRVEVLSAKHISVSSDIVAILDRDDNKTIRIFDANGGRPLNNIVHTQEIAEISISTFSRSLQERLVAFIDANRDLYITPVTKQNSFKLGTMTDSIYWNDASDMLAVVTDGHLVTWFYPGIAYVDRDLLRKAKASKNADQYGKLAQLVNFFGNRVSVRKVDGSLLYDR